MLEARGLSCRLEQQEGHWQLLVSAEQLPRALDELRRFEAENRHWPPQPAQPVALRRNNLVTLSVLGLLGIFHNLARLDIHGIGGGVIDWRLLGNADAGAIRAGQWWRAVTALTLHADDLHLLGNLLIGGFFIDRLNRELGAGRGWALVLAAGTLGNLVNALLRAERPSRRWACRRRCSAPWRSSRCAAPVIIATASRSLAPAPGAAGWQGCSAAMAKPGNLAGIEERSAPTRSRLLEQPWLACRPTAEPGIAAGVGAMCSGSRGLAWQR
ncbi:MAG: rhomboid family intramembrane serine protease [Syntrophotaleaceae bacterium]